MNVDTSSITAYVIIGEAMTKIEDASIERYENRKIRE